MNSDTAQTTTMCGEIHFVLKFKMAVHHFISCILKSLMTLECGVMQDYAKWGTFLNTLQLEAKTDGTVSLHVREAFFWNTLYAQSNSFWIQHYLALILFYNLPSTHAVKQSYSYYGDR